jgi:hypothetical protein
MANSKPTMKKPIYYKRKSIVGMYKQLIETAHLHVLSTHFIDKQDGYKVTGQANKRLHGI